MANAIAQTIATAAHTSSHQNLRILNRSANRKRVTRAARSSITPDATKTIELVSGSQGVIGNSLATAVTLTVMDRTRGVLICETQ